MKKLMMPASIRLTVFCLFWLTVLTFWGTVYQVENGIYQAQDKFFDSIVFSAGADYVGEGFFKKVLFNPFIFVLNKIPFPGGMLTMGLLFVNLLFSFLVHYQAGWKMPGLMLIHIGLLMMLLGGLFTKMTGIEATISLFEGEGRNAAMDRTEWEISFYDELHAYQEFQAVDVSDLRKGRTFRFRDSDLEFKVRKVHENVRGVRPDPSAEPPDTVPVNPAGFVDMEKLPRSIQPEEHTPGVRLSVTGAKEAGDILLTARDQRPLGIELEDGSVRFLALRRKRYQLPLFMELNDFSRSYYPGTDTPRDYRSLITVHHDDDNRRDVVVKMNQPFRFAGWTFYQQSFAVTENSEMSVFAVTRNLGRRIPYWATGITSLGLAMHFMQMMWMQLKRRGKKA